MSNESISRHRFLSASMSGLGLTALAQTAVAQSRPTSENREYNVRAHGAKGDGVAFDTPAIQAAIDACSLAGGGKVVLQGGRFLTRTIHLKSNVTLFIEAGAVLMGTNRLEDYAEIKPSYVSYTYAHRALIYAEKTENVSIEGKGAIDLQGRDFPKQQKGGGQMEWGQSPFAVRLVECRNLTVRDVTIRNCPMVALRIVAGQNVLVDGVVIDNRVRISCDGIEIVSSREVCVSNCRVNSWDDGICIKSASADPCRNITISNCTVSSLCNAIKFGTESNAGFENIAVSNCVIEGGEMDGWRSINGLALEIVDGGVMDQVLVSNLSIRGVRTAIFIRLGNRARLYSQNQPKPGIGVLKNVRISQVLAEVTNPEYCCSITGEPGHPVENVVLENVQVRYPGGGTPEAASRTVPEKPAAYPESIMFGPLPAYGMYCRHARHVTLRNVQFELAKPDARPAIVCDDVEDLDLSGLKAANSGSEPLIRLTQVRRALLQGCQPAGDVEAFVSVEGDRSTDVALLGNDLRRVRKQVVAKDGFNGDVASSGNLS